MSDAGEDASLTLALVASLAMAWTRQVINIALIGEGRRQAAAGQCSEALTHSMPDMLEGATDYFQKRPAVRRHGLTR